MPFCAAQPSIRIPVVAAATFTRLDALVLGSYLLLLLVSGWVLSLRKQRTTGDYFLGGRSMPVWAVACSLVATAMSAATFVGGPQQAYSGDLTYLSSNLGVLFALMMTAFFFLPAYYRLGVGTVYELLEHRLGRGARQAASGMFLVGRVMASGARIYIAALPAALILFGDAQPRHVMPAIGVLAVAGILYTFVGGVRSVIFTDVLQLVVFVGAAGAALWVLANRLPLDMPAIVDALRNPPDGSGSKLALVKTGLDARGHGIDFASPYTLLTAVTGLTLLNLAAYATDQDLAQRMLTCRSAVRGSASALVSIAVNLPVTALFMAVGLGLYIFYQRPDLLEAAAPGSAPTYGPGAQTYVFVTFVLHELPAGLRGLFLAGLFAAALSSFNSALNAMGSAFVLDLYRPLRPGRDERHYLRMGRASVVVAGVLLAGFACLCVLWHAAGAEKGQTLIDFALAVMTFAYAGLLGVFLTALFTGRGNSGSAITALAVGFGVVLIFQPMVWERLTPEAWHGRIAFAWPMTVATAAAFAVCCLGRRVRQA